VGGGAGQQRHTCESPRTRYGASSTGAPACTLAISQCCDTTHCPAAHAHRYLPQVQQVSRRVKGEATVSEAATGQKAAATACKLQGWRT
jgi:hypothetical protein